MHTHVAASGDGRSTGREAAPRIPGAWGGRWARGRRGKRAWPTGEQGQARAALASPRPPGSTASPSHHTCCEPRPSGSRPGEEPRKLTLPPPSSPKLSPKHVTTLPRTTAFSKPTRPLCARAASCPPASPREGLSIPRPASKARPATEQANLHLPGANGSGRPGREAACAPGDAEGRAGGGTEPHAAGPGRQPRAPPGTCAEKAPPLKPACGGPPAPDGQAVLRFGETLDMDRGRHARPAREVGGSARAAPTAIHSELVASPEGAAAASLRTPRVDGPLPKLRGERQDRRASARAPRQTPAGPAGSPGTPCAGDPTGRRGGGRRGAPAILPNGAQGGPCAGRACTCPQRRLAEHAPRAAGRPGARRWDGPGASWARGAAHTPVAVLPSGPTSSPRTEWTRRGQAAMLGGADS